MTQLFLILPTIFLVACSEKSEKIPKKVVKGNICVCNSHDFLKKTPVRN